MASLLSIANGNFTTGTTWGLVDSTSVLDSEAANTVLTTSYVGATTFAPGAITIDAIAVKVAVRVGSTGTMSVELYNSTAGAQVAGTEVTINVSDINAGDTATNGGCGWYVFKFASPVTLAGATNYAVRAKTSSSTQVNLFSSATNNWSRLLRTTTTQAPASADNLYVAGEWTAAATSTTFTVTMDETATTAYGNIAVSNKSKLTFGTTASTNYYLKSKMVYVYGGGTFEIGTSGTPIPSTSTAVMEFNCTSAGEFGVRNLGGGTVSMYGNRKNNWRTLLTADEAASQTVIGPLVSTTDWAVSDEIAFPTTTKTRAQFEKKTILTVDSSTQVTLSAGLTYAHSGTAPTQAEVANLTRNVKFRGISSSFVTYFRSFETAVSNIDSVEFTNFGSNFSLRQGFSVNTTTGTFNCQYCSIHDNNLSAATPFVINSASGSGITISNNILYNCGDGGISNVATTGVQVFDNNYIIGTTNTGFSFGDSGCTVTNNKVASVAQIGIVYNEGGAALGTFSGNTCHGNGAQGFYISSLASGTILNCTSWRNTIGIELGFTTGSSGYGWSCTVDNFTAFGNSQRGFKYTGNYGRGVTTVKDSTFNGGVTQVTPIGVDLGAGCIDALYFTDCNFGVTGGAHSTSEFIVGFSTLICNVQFFNCAWGTTTFFQSSGAAAGQMITSGPMWKGISSSKHGGVSGDYRNWQGGGTLQPDSSIFNTGSPSLRMVTFSPYGNNIILESPTLIVPVISGGTATVSVWVRKSAAGDGTAYTGFQPRLMIRANPVLGYDVDTAVDTAAAATGTWEELTFTTSAAAENGALEFYVDCGATGPWPATCAGWVNVDDFTATTTAGSTAGMAYPYRGKPYLTVPNAGGGGSSGGSWGFC